MLFDCILVGSRQLVYKLKRQLNTIRVFFNLYGQATENSKLKSLQPVRTN